MSNIIYVCVACNVFQRELKFRKVHHCFLKYLMWHSINCGNSWVTCVPTLTSGFLFSWSGAVFIKLLRKISNLSENFKCRFLYLYPHYFNETLHACEKHCFSQACKVSLKYNWKYIGNMHLKFSLKFEISLSNFMNTAPGFTGWKTCLFEKWCHLYTVKPV